ncbi:MAG: ABC transporter ATP-binding protein [Oscillospiraceae bacterium]|nr:ABC transporter ATP-binding protein [Oscillospiraceae bacterium]
MGVYGKLFRYVSAIRREVALKTLLLLVISAISIFQAIMMSRAVNLVWSRSALAQILPCIAAVIAAILLRSLLTRRNETFTKTMAARIKDTLRLAVLDKVYRLGPGHMNEKRSGKVTSLVLDGIEALEPFFVSFIPQIFTVLVSGIFIFVYLAAFDVLSALVLLIAMLLCIFLPMLTVPLMHRSVTDYWTEYSGLTSQYIDAIQGMTTLKTLHAEETMGDILYRDATSFWHRSIRNTGISLAGSGFMLVLTGVTASLTVVMAALRFRAGLAPAASVTAFLFLTVECARPMLELNRHWHASFLGISVAKELFDLIETVPPVQDPAEPAPASAGEALPSIGFRDACFAYPGREEVLHNVTLSVPAGSTTAIVGHSGSGKSTLLNLILRFYDVSAGQVTIDGRDVRDCELTWLRRQIAVVFQDTYLFYGTIAENIRMAAPEASDEEVMAAARAAHAHEFIQRMPQGYDTVVGERGVTLSGGERQRIAIARAILKNAPILLLDEATSSVDAQSEALIQQSLARLTQQRTTVIVAHRLSTVRSADNIIVIEDGRVAEQGTHEALLARDGVYRALIRAQEEVSR